MKTKKIPEKDLKELILLQFGSQANLARKLKVADSRITKGIQLQSPKFMAQLKLAGLKLDSLSKEGESGSAKDAQEKIRALKERVMILEEMVKQKDKIIDNQNNLIEKYSRLFEKSAGTKK